MPTEPTERTFSSVIDWFNRHRHPHPAPPAPGPAPAPPNPPGPPPGPGGTPPPHLAQAWSALQDHRRALGFKPWRWDDRLARAAGELVDYYRQGGREGHWDMDGRFARAGFPKGALGSGPSDHPLRALHDNTSEFVESGGADPLAAQVRDVIHFFRPENLQGMPNEGHVADFTASWPCAGIACGEDVGVFVIDYGDPDAPPPPAPNP